MATNVALDQDLLDQARAVGGHETEKEAVTIALEEYIARRKQLGITSRTTMRRSRRSRWWDTRSPWWLPCRRERWIRMRRGWPPA